MTFHNNRCTVIKQNGSMCKCYIQKNNGTFCHIHSKQNTTNMQKENSKLVSKVQHIQTIIEHLSLEHTKINSNMYKIKIYNFLIIVSHIYTLYYILKHVEHHNLNFAQSYNSFKLYILNLYSNLFSFTCHYLKRYTEHITKLIDFTYLNIDTFANKTITFVHLRWQMVISYILLL